MGTVKRGMTKARSGARGFTRRDKPGIIKEGKNPAPHGLLRAAAPGGLAGAVTKKAKEGETCMKITEDILYVGVNDHDIDLFEG